MRLICSSVFYALAVTQLAISFNIPHHLSSSNKRTSQLFSESSSAEQDPFRPNRVIPSIREDEVDTVTTISEIQEEDVNGDDDAANGDIEANGEMGLEGNEDKEEYQPFFGKRSETPEGAADFEENEIESEPDPQQLFDEKNMRIAIELAQES